MTKKQYVEPAMDVIALATCHRLLAGSPDDTMDLHDEEKNVTESEVW